MNNGNTIDFENVVPEGPDATLESPDGPPAEKSKAADFSPPPDSNLFDPIAEEKVADDLKEAEAAPAETTTEEAATTESTPAEPETTDESMEAEEKAPDPPVQTNEDDTIDMVDFVLEGKRALTRKITRNTSANPSAAGETTSISPDAIANSAAMDKIHDVAEMS